MSNSINKRSAKAKKTSLQKTLRRIGVIVLSLLAFFYLFYQLISVVGIFKTF